MKFLKSEKYGKFENVARIELDRGGDVLYFEKPENLFKDVYNILPNSYNYRKVHLIHPATPEKWKLSKANVNMDYRGPYLYFSENFDEGIPSLDHLGTQFLPRSVWIEGTFLDPNKFKHLKPFPIWRDINKPKKYIEKMLRKGYCVYSVEARIVEDTTKASISTYPEYIKLWYTWRTEIEAIKPFFDKGFEITLKGR